MVMKRIFLMGGTLLLAGGLGAGELAGVSLPERVAVAGQDLVLNGMGLRKKAIFKVYVGALYLAEKSGDPAKILAADAPRRMVMRFLRSVGKDRLVEAWKEGFANNAPQAQETLKGEIERFLSLWRDVQEGEEVTMTYIPGTGTTLAFAGKEVGTFAGKAFADALLAVWLGPKPPSEELKAGLLGR
jgi:hypothetical protein